jgi:hypothetical protein
MVNKEKAIKRDLIRLRKTQNPTQIDFRRMRKRRAAKTSLLKLKRKGTVAPVREVSAEKKKKAKPKKKPKKAEPELEVIEDEPELEVIDEEPEVEEVEEEPELEVVEEEPELEVVEDEPEKKDISEELEDLYSYDDDIDDEDIEEDSE